MKNARWSIDAGLIRWDDEEHDMVEYLDDIIWERWPHQIDCVWMVLK